MNKPLVSIVCITFNQEQYIAQCIDGFMMQKTDFPYEVLINDDASTDKTADIVRLYEKKYPDIIKPVYQTKNQYSLGINPGLILFPLARGKYIAVCEGDDYWTDPYKLQKQVDFLEKNEEYALCCHRYKIFDTETNEYTSDYCEHLFKPETKGISFEALDIFKNWYTKTLTVVFRNTLDYSGVVANYKHFRDVHLFYHILKKGKGYIFNFNAGVYTIHPGGVFSAASRIKRLKDGTYIFKELAEFNPELIPVYQQHIENIKTLLNDNILGDRFPFLNKKNYLILQLLYETKYDKVYVLKKFTQLFTSIPKKILRKGKNLIGKNTVKPEIHN